MAVFAYKALDGRQSPVDGTVAAESPRQARDMLRARGLRVEAVRRREPRGSPFARLWPPRRHGAKVAGTIRDLGTLIGAGVPLLDALQTVSRSHAGDFLASLQHLQDRVAAGAGLAEAMAEQPEVYDELVVQMVAVGERAGNLEEVLGHVADFKERFAEFKDRVLTALLYPAIVFAASVAVSLFLMTSVVPMLLNNLIEADRALPWPTRVLKAVSDRCVDSGGWLAVLAVGALLLAATLLRTGRGRLLWHRLLLRLPLVGPMARQQAISRIALVLATLLRSGIMLVEALEIAARATGNLVLRQALQRARSEVQTGRDLGRALETTGAFPPVVVQIFAVGQRGGRLEEMLARLAIDSDRQVAVRAARLAAALEPVLILGLAVLVGFILFATVLPILEAGRVL